MSRITLDLNEPLIHDARRLAEQEHVSLEQFLSRLVGDALQTHELWNHRIRRGQQVTRERFLEILAKAPEVPPVPGDEIDPQP